MNPAAPMGSFPTAPVSAIGVVNALLGQDITKSPVELALLSADTGSLFTSTAWYAGESIGLRSENATYSAPTPFYVAEYTAVSAEVISDWMIKLYAATGTAFIAEVWHLTSISTLPTGIFISVGAADTEARNTTDELQLAVGDKLAFVSDTTVTPPGWVSVRANRRKA